MIDDDERGPKNPTLRLKLEAVDQFTPEEQEHVAAFIEGALLRHHARQAFSGQASEGQATPAPPITGSS